MTDVDRATDDARTGELCAYCAESIDTSEWHPVVARTENGEFELYPFCDEDCRDDWEESER